jgi:rod shape-determining protein MreD
MLGKIAGFAALVILAIIFQTFFASLISIEKVMPDIFVILVVYLTLTKSLTYGALFGFIAGIAESSSDPYLFGLSALLKVLLAMIVFMFSTRLRLESNFARILVVFISVIVHNTFYYLTAFGLDIQLVLYSAMKYALLDAVYSAVIAVILVYLSVRKLTLKFEA